MPLRVISIHKRNTMARIPIWKDKWVTLTPATGAESVVYSIYTSLGKLLYTGEAKVRPDGTCSVRVNDICANYLSRMTPPQMNFAATEGEDEDGEYERYFEVKVGSSTVAQFTFVNDWSYDLAKATEEGGSDIATFDNPICTDYVLGQPLILGTYADDLIYIRTIIGKAGLTGRRMVDLCNAHAIYYVNKYGTWEYLLLKGGIVESEEYERSQYGREYDNGTPSARGTVVSRNAVTKKWRCFTGNLPHEAGLRIGDLLGTPDAYLWDAVNGFRPIVIDETSAQLLTARKNGRQAVSYSFNVTLAQERERR